MEHCDKYSFKGLEDDEKTEAYAKVLRDLKKAERIIDTFVALSKAYPVDNF
jgi:nitrogen regulatory protein PII-like uncharacterized protein